jgi:hypothetical protein
VEGSAGGSPPGKIENAERMSRPQAIALLRAKLTSMTDEEHCMCAAAAKVGVFCRGFARLSDQEFRSRFDWIARKRPHASRPELEEIVNLYHLGRQEVTGTALCCDLETREHTSCDGWNTFDNETLAQFCLEVAGRAVRIE